MSSFSLLERRIRRLEIGGPPSFDGDGPDDDDGPPRLIVIRGGLPGPLHATLIGHSSIYEPAPGEPYEAFAGRMLARAAALGVRCVVIGGLQADVTGEGE